MENITTGHWIFAGLFFIVFFGYLLWGYRKDLKMHRLYYGNAVYVAVAIIVILFGFYVFKRVL